MITTSGQGAIGLYASNAAKTGAGGAISVSGPLSVTTGTGPFSYSAWAQSAGSTITLSGPSAITMNGGAFALFATQGGSIVSANTLGVVANGGAGGGVEVDNPGSSVTLKGATNIALNEGGDAGLFATSGGTISVQVPTMITVSRPRSVGAEALSCAVTASGALNITTLQASSPAFALSGASPPILATGGGTVSAAADAIDFTFANNAIATFDNFERVGQFDFRRSFDRDRQF
jgi:hypothetical protein